MQIGFSNHYQSKINFKGNPSKICNDFNLGKKQNIFNRTGQGGSVNPGNLKNFMNGYQKEGQKSRVNKMKDAFENLSSWHKQFKNAEDNIKKAFKTPPYEQGAKKTGNRSHSYDRNSQQSKSGFSRTSPKKTYCDILGVKEAASKEEIKAAHKKVIKEWHPDKHLDPEANKIAEEKTQKINEARDQIFKMNGW